MIAFPTEFVAYFNKKMHDFLLVELFDDYIEEDFLNFLSGVFPSHLVREQKEKCATVLRDLFDWTGDEYWHEMTAFHELGLYNFLSHMNALREDMPEFDSIYYDDKDRAELESLMTTLDIHTMYEGTVRNVDDLGEQLHDPVTMQSLCFEDADFLMLPMLSNHRSVGDISLEQILGIDFEYYMDILPSDIRVRLEKAKSSVLFEVVGEMLDYLSERVAYGGYYKDFWHREEPKSESEIQVTLDSVFAMYLKGNEHLDISREVEMGTGRIDFKFHKDSSQKVLIEVKLGSSTHLESGLKKQLVHYMDAFKCKEAFYLVVCHSEKEVARVKRLYESCEDIEESGTGKHIAIHILDVTPKVTASKL